MIQRPGNKVIGEEIFGDLRNFMLKENGEGNKVRQSD